MSVSYAPHFCWPDETKPWGRMLNETSPCFWLLRRNAHLHKCQRCSYIKWRADTTNGEQE